MDMKRLGTGLAAKLQSRRVETEAQVVTGSTESNGGFIRKAGVIALGTIALAGAVAAVPATTEAYEEAPAGAELVAYRGGHHFGGHGHHGGGGGGALLWGFGLGLGLGVLTNPCIWNYCGPVYPQPYPPVQMRGPWHYGPTNPNPWGEWHFHDNMGHYYGG